MQPTPLLLLTGFLGAGKTTLLRHLLDALPPGRLAILENEFAQLGIDQDLLPRAAALEISNGSICCTSRADLGLALGRLARERHRYDALVIETTGMADPGPILHALLTDEELAEQFELRAVAVVVDALHALEQLRGPREFRAQIALADLLLLSKTDLIQADQLPLIERELRALNPGAPVFPVAHGKIDPSSLLGVQRFDLPRTLARTPRLLEDTSHEHESSVSSVCIEEEGIFLEILLSSWLSELLTSGHLLRIKGFLPTGNGWILVQGVRSVLDISPCPPPPSGHLGRLVLIGEGLDPAAIQRSLLRCKAPQAPPPLPSLLSLQLLLVRHAVPGPRPRL